MDKSKLAEKILSLVMEPLQAAAVVGDLLEARPARSALWFWTNVGQTFCATLGRSLARRPGFVLGVAALTVLREIYYSVLLGLGALVVLCAWNFIATPNGTPIGAPAFFYYANFACRPIAAFLAARWMVGFWTTGFSKGGDLGAWMMMILLRPLMAYLLSLVITRVIWLFFHGVQMPPFTLWHWWSGELWLAGLVGLALERRRRYSALVKN